MVLYISWHIFLFLEIHVLLTGVTCKCDLQKSPRAWPVLHVNVTRRNPRAGGGGRLDRKMQACVSRKMPNLHSGKHCYGGLKHTRRCRENTSETSLLRIHNAYVQHYGSG